MLDLYPITLEMARDAARVAAQLERHDRDLARQMRRAAASVPLNVAEGMYSRGKLRGARYHTALGSARETLACIEVAAAMGYVVRVDDDVTKRMQRVIGTLVRLVRPRG